MTDRPARPDTEPHLPHVEPTGPGFTLEVPRAPRVPEFSTEPPESDAIKPTPEQDPMKHAPRWGRHLHVRMCDVFDRIGAVEKAVASMSDSLAPDQGMDAMRKQLVADISHAVSGYVDAMLAKYQELVQQVHALNSRLHAVEAKVALRDE